MMRCQDSKFVWCKWLAIGSVFSGSALSADVPLPPDFYSYLSNQPGCRADTSTDQELIIDGDGQQWVIVAPAHVVSTGRHQSYDRLAKVPLDLEIAKPLESALQNRIAGLQSVDKGSDHPLKITRIKIVSVWHDITRLGMGEAVAQIALRFNICANGDIPQSTSIQEVTRSGPKMSTLWHQLRGEALRLGFQKAADEAFRAIVDFALRAPD
jgi:hypothetical protein